jgi:hypothetical protein
MVTLHCYNKNQHLIFKYHYKASARRDRLNQKKHELAEQIKDSSNVNLQSNMSNWNGTNGFAQSSGPTMSNLIQIRTPRLI